ADHVVVDMDSMYGPMSWLRLHAAGRKVIGLTSAPRTQTDYRLGRPFDTDQMVELLVAVAQGAGTRLEPVASAAAAAAAGIVAPTAATGPAATSPSPPAGAAVAEAGTHVAGTTSGAVTHDAGTASGAGTHDAGIASEADARDAGTTVAEPHAEIADAV